MGLIYFYLAKEPLCPVIPAHCLLSLQQVLCLICVSAPLQGYLGWVIGHLDNIAGKKHPLICLQLCHTLALEKSFPLWDTHL